MINWIRGQRGDPSILVCASEKTAFLYMEERKNGREPRLRMKAVNSVSKILSWS